MKLGLIGNCAYQALISQTGHVEWLCWPRFDSSFVFGRLLDDNSGGEFSISPADDEFTSEQRYMTGTNVLQTEFQSNDGNFEVLDFAPRFRQYDRHFKPTMLVRVVRPTSGNPFVKVACRPVYDYGTTQLAHYAASNHIGWMLPGAQLRLTTNAPLTYLESSRPFALDQEIYLVLTWGQPLEAPLAETCEAFLRKTVRYWRGWVRQTTLPESYQDHVIRSALTLKLHQYDDTGAITAATTTSLTEYPGSGRTWDYRFCWPRDAVFTVSALRRLGQYEEMAQFVEYLVNIAKSNSNLQPVYGIGGETDLQEETLDHLAGYLGDGPVRRGNGAYVQVQNDVYGEMVVAMAPLFLDVRFRDHMGAWATGLLRDLVRHMEDKLESPDAGLWEKRAEPSIHTFSLLMHWAGARAASAVAAHLGDSTLRQRGLELASRASSIIDGQCWNAAGGFYADTPGGNNADASLLLMVNSGYLSPDNPRAKSHVEALAQRLRANDHLLYRYRHDDGIGETHAAFTVCGFWHAEALARLGLRPAATNQFQALLRHCNHVGLFSEDLDPSTGTMLGNFPQAYSHVGVINTAFALSPPATSPI